MSDRLRPAFACPKCQGTDVVRGVRVTDHGHLNQELDLSLTVYLKPDAVISKSPVSHPLRTKVFGSCGFTEFYVENPHELLEWSRKVKADT